ncbi:MAG TPA: hypothetical protein VEC56_00480 [Candidatus Krumholzibacteria bacterium]|nr:hypothetical protein [Candidatus Krumholzibacteria bacterium]
MTPEIPAYITTLVIAAAFAIAIAVTMALSRAAGRSGLPHASQRRVRLGSMVFFGVWLAAVMLLAPTSSPPASVDSFAIAPLIPLAAVGSLAVALVAVARSASLRRVLLSVPLATLNALQVWRVVGILFVILLAQGVLPAHFALPAGWGDVAVGVTAPWVALALSRGVRGSAAIAIGWNVFGLLDLVVAVGMGTGLLAPVLVPELGPRVPPAAAMGMLPMILVPTFAVPASVMVHVLALHRLRRDAQSAPAARGALIARS